MITTSKYWSQYIGNGYWWSLDETSNDWEQSEVNRWYLPNISSFSKYSICPPHLNQWGNQDIILNRNNKTMAINTGDIPTNSVCWYRISRNSRTDESGIKLTVIEARGVDIQTFNERTKNKLDNYGEWNPNKWFVHVNDLDPSDYFWIIVTSQGRSSYI